MKSYLVHALFTQTGNQYSVYIVHGLALIWDIGNVPLPGMKQAEAAVKVPMLSPALPKRVGRFRRMIKAISTLI